MEIARYLLSKEINVNLLDHLERSALYFAIEAKHLELANLLISKGAKVIAASHESASEVVLPKLICSNARRDLVVVVNKPVREGSA